MKPKMINKGDGEYEYCGYTIERKDGISSGYFGRWRVWGQRNAVFSTQAEAKAWVDEKIYQRGAKAAQDNEMLPEDCPSEFERGWRDEVNAILRQTDNSAYIKKMARQIGLA